MDRSSVIYLLTTTYEQDEFGIFEEETTQKLVYAQVESVTGAEWFEGGRNGLNPEYRFTMFAPDYSGEQVLIYDDVQYTIYRTYRTKNETIELYAEKRKGNE